MSSIQKHIQSVKHSTGKEKLARNEKRDMDIVEALQKYDSEFHPSGETLPDTTRVYRVKVFALVFKSWCTYQQDR